MKKILSKAWGIGLIFWPLSLFLANTQENFIHYLIPTLLLIISYLLYLKNSKVFLFPPILIAIIEIKLLPFILIFLFISMLSNPGGKRIVLFLLLLIMVTYGLLNRQLIMEQIVLKFDYEKQQEVIREIHLYPNVLMARIFQNKVRLVADKYTENLFALSDPNNYFFSNHPREDATINQNLVKYPFLSIIPVLLGFYYLRKDKNSKFMLTVLVSAIFGLSLLINFDRHDFILYLPLSSVFIAGFNILMKTKAIISYSFIFVFIVLSLIELVRIFYIF